MLTEGDFKARASFADEIGRYCYPVDIPLRRFRLAFAAITEAFEMH